MKTIAFIDFDGTIYDGDSMLEFAKILRGDTFVKKALFKCSFNIFMKKLGLRPSQKAKEQFLSYILNGIDDKSIALAVQELTKSFDGRIYKTAAQELAFLEKQNTQIVIVSASCELWLKPWSEGRSYELVSSKLERVNNTYSGKLIGKNCKGEEKVNRIKASYNLKDFDKIYCYGNDASDEPMIELANQETKVLYR